MVLCLPHPPIIYAADNHTISWNQGPNDKAILINQEIMIKDPNDKAIIIRWHDFQ